MGGGGGGFKKSQNQYDVIYVQAAPMWVHIFVWIGQTPVICSSTEWRPGRKLDLHKTAPAADIVPLLDYYLVRNPRISWL